MNGGLDLAVHMAIPDTRTVWVSDVEPGPNKILAERFPHAPNLGDITTIDWDQVEPVDILAGGFPCQPVSVAGTRKGVTDERWLFDEIITALSVLDPRPKLCVFENVPGLLTANRGDAMARVIEGLASAGYVGRYGVHRAADIGAPHRRERVFIVAHPHGTKLAEWGQRLSAGTEHSTADSRHPLLPTLWGQYAPAVHQWEQILGREAPPPTAPDSRGYPQLSPRFVEWMMGLPEGWVTDVDISRAQQLRALGNGVVPQQGATAITHLLGREEAA